MAKKLTDAQKDFAALSDAAKLDLLARVFNILELDEDGNPGNSWSADTTQSLGEAFNDFGVVFTAVEDGDF